MSTKQRRRRLHALAHTRRPRWGDAQTLTDAQLEALVNRAYGRPADAPLSDQELEAIAAGVNPWEGGKDANG